MSATINVTVNPDKGWFANLPGVTGHHVMGMLVKANLDPKSPVNVQFHSEHWAGHKTSATMQQAARMGENLAQDFKTVPPWTGAGGRGH
jgi:hypothetical protein